MRLILSVIFVVGALVSPIQGATLSGPIAFGSWSFESGTLAAEFPPPSFVGSGPTEFTGIGGAVESGAGIGGGFALRLNHPPASERNHVDFSFSNLHPTETISLEEIRFDTRTNFGASILSMNFLRSGELEAEINDAVVVGETWSSPAFDLASLTQIGIPWLNFELAPGESIALRIVIREDIASSGSPVFFDNVLVTGRTVIPEPSTSGLALLSIVLLIRRRR
jgi:hypothetical protein